MLINQSRRFIRRVYKPEAMYTESAFGREELEGSGGRKEAKEGMKGVEFLRNICERDVILSLAAHSEDLHFANWAFGHSSRERVNFFFDTFKMKMNHTCSVSFSKHFEIPNVSSIRDSVLPGMERSKGAMSTRTENLWKTLELKEEVRENVRKPCETAQGKNRSTC